MQQRKAVCVSDKAALNQVSLVPRSTPLPYRHCGTSSCLFPAPIISLSVMNCIVQSLPHAVLSLLSATCCCVMSSPRNSCKWRAEDLLSPLVSPTQSPARSVRHACWLVDGFVTSTPPSSLRFHLSLLVYHSSLLAECSLPAMMFQPKLEGRGLTWGT